MLCAKETQLESVIPFYLCSFATCLTAWLSVAYSEDIENRFLPSACNPEEHSPEVGRVLLSLSLVTTQPASYQAQRDRKASHPGIPSGVWSLLENVQRQELTLLSGNTFSCFLTLVVRELFLSTSLISNLTGALTFSPAAGTHTQCQLSALGSRRPRL